MFSVSWLGVLLGALVGVLCILGLGLGLRIILNNIPEEGSERPLKKGKLTLGAVLLGGQFVLALAILYFTRRHVQDPLGTALGLLISIFAGSLFLRNIRPKK